MSVDETTGSVTLRVLFPNPDKLLLPGMYVRETIDEGVRNDALLGPAARHHPQPEGEPTAMVVGTDKKVELRALVTDRAIGDKWLVSDGLKAGDRVIVEGLQFASPARSSGRRAARRTPPERCNPRPACTGRTLHSTGVVGLEHTWSTSLSTGPSSPG